MFVNPETARAMLAVLPFASVANHHEARLHAFLQHPRKDLNAIDGSERQNCEHRARCLGIYEQCSFVGKQPRIVDYLSVADLLLLPSEQESFGLAALEAMACEVPVIASRVGGLPEVVTDGETGFLSPVGDLDKMATDAARLLADHDMLREFGQRARDSAITRYRTDVVIPQYIEFYEKVIAKNSH